jgi:hypothetical protein
MHSRNISVSILKQEIPVVLSLRNKLLFVAGSNFPLIFYSSTFSPLHTDTLRLPICYILYKRKPSS